MNLPSFMFCTLYIVGKKEGVGEKEGKKEGLVMNSRERRGEKTMSFYNSGDGNRTPEISIVPKVVRKSSLRLWGFRKPKVVTVNETKEREDGNLMIEARNSVSCVENKEKGEKIGYARKSVSAVESKEEGKINGQVRKSVSHVERKEERRIIVEARKDVPRVERKEERKVMIEARKSVSHVETNLTSVVGFLQVKILAVDMPGYMQVHAFRCARRTYDSLEKFSSRHMAFNIKKEFDQAHGPAWHCIVGSSFGSFVTYSTGCFIYFSMEKIYILVFKTKVQKALD